MNGRIGSLHNGEQLAGGILDWSLDLILASTTRDTLIYNKLAKWKLTAQSYWFFDKPDNVTVRLYPDSGKGYWEGEGHITSEIQKLFDTLIHSEIIINGEGVLEGKE